MSKHAVSRRFWPLTLAALLAGCGAGEPAADEGAAGTGEPAAQASPIDLTNAGVISGRVAFEGGAPAPTAIDMSEEPTCAAKHTGGAWRDDVLVGEGGGLGNVFVYVKEGLGAYEFPTPSEAVVLDQDGCVYHPHVAGIQVGQSLTVRNSDGLLHNINARPAMNRGFNISQPTTMESTRNFSTAEVMIPIACDVHGWMQAYLGVLEHPYYAVTDGNGSFSLGQLPPGDYVIEAWHERYGTQTMTVSLSAQETKAIDFRYDASMARSAVVPLGDPLEPHDHVPAGEIAARHVAAASGR